MIRVLTEIGVPVETIKAFAESRTPEKLMKLLSKHKDIISDKLRFWQDSYMIICTQLDLLNNGISATEDEIYVSEMPEKSIIMGGATNFEGAVGFQREFTSFCNAQYEPKINLSYPIGGYFESMDEFLDEAAQPTRFFSIDPNGNERKNAGLYLIGYTRGYYGETNDLPQQMAAFAKKNGLVFNGPVYNIYLSEEISEADPEQYLLQVSASVSEKQLFSSRQPLRQFVHE
jgi:hypothetical protein